MLSIRPLWMLALLLAPLLHPGSTAAQASAERVDVVVIGEDCSDCVISLAREWRYRAGDDPSWADPRVDDSSWEYALPSLGGAEVGSDDWQGIGWFRRRIRTTSSFGDSLGLHMLQAGASEIYLDGHLVASFGRVATDPKAEEPMLPQFAASIAVEPEVDHLLAVRYSNVTGNVLQREFRGFELHIGDMQALSEHGLRIVRQYTAFMAGSIGLFGALTLLHLLLFAFRPQATENLYFALFTACVVGMLLAENQASSISEFSRVFFYYNWFLTASIGMALSALVIEHKVFKRQLGVTFWALCAAAVGVVAWVWTRTAFGQDLLPTAVFLAIVYLVTLWLALHALAEREPDAWVIGLGFLILTLCVFATLLRVAGWLELPPDLSAVIGLGALALCFSVYLTRRVARTAKELETKLAEVEQLTSRTIEQERRAAREELERRVLEEDNRRKTAELEEARALQLAMLPSELPRLANYEIAVHMSTANEVGGDYYDFHSHPDGSCTLAVGDATGHGLHAGMVVGAAKSLFQTWCHDPNLALVLERIGEGLTSMHRRQASMAMLLVHLSNNGLVVASAGMPPILIWRHDSRKVQEALNPSVPLGTLAGVRFGESQIDLRLGDCALIMTDGFAEVMSPDGELLGYEGASQLFAQVAHLEPRAAVTELLTRVAEFHADTPLHDDMTLIVLKART
jgi:serine phosphatase RsbU (regulator of sigma subunit)